MATGVASAKEQEQATSMPPGARRRAAAEAKLGAFAGVRPLRAQERPLDDLAAATAWRAIPSDGVEMRLSREPKRHS